MTGAAIVTGGASGIGAACIAMLRAEGFRVGVIDLDVEAWLDMLRIHVGGTTHAVRAVLPGMLARRSGAIVCIGSELGLIGDPSAPHYAAAVRFALLEDTTLTGKVVSPNGGAVL